MAFLTVLTSREVSPSPLVREGLMYHWYTNISPGQGQQVGDAVVITLESGTKIRRFGARLGPPSAADPNSKAEAVYVCDPTRAPVVIRKEKSTGEPIKRETRYIPPPDPR
jgi:hypothetical protein